MQERNRVERHYPGKGKSLTWLPKVLLLCSSLIKTGPGPLIRKGCANGFWAAPLKCREKSFSVGSANSRKEACMQRQEEDSYMGETVLCFLKLLRPGSVPGKDAGSTRFCFDVNFTRAPGEIPSLDLRLLASGVLINVTKANNTPLDVGLKLSDAWGGGIGWLPH